MAGGFAMLTALIPTTFNAIIASDGNVTMEYFNIDGPLAHNESELGMIHLASAGLFLFIMGYLAIYKFTKSEEDSEEAKRRNKVYLWSGRIVWICIAIILIMIILKGFGVKPFLKNYVFFAEAVALFFFGNAWITKSEYPQLKF